MLKEKSQRQLPPGFELERHMADLDTDGFTGIR